MKNTQPKDKLQEPSKEYNIIGNIHEDSDNAFYLLDEESFNEEQRILLEILNNESHEKIINYMKNYNLK